MSQKCHQGLGGESILRAWHKESTAVFAWELANELICRICPKTTISNWATKVSGYITSLDSCQIVTVNDEAWLSPVDDQYDESYADRAWALEGFVWRESASHTIREWRSPFISKPLEFVVVSSYCSEMGGHYVSSFSYSLEMWGMHGIEFRRNCGVIS